MASGRGSLSHRVAHGRLTWQDPIAAFPFADEAEALGAFVFQPRER